MPGKEVYDVAIIGAGIVGLAGAVYARRMNLKTIVFGNERGGTLAKTHLVENYPGFISLSGPELMDKILEHAKVYQPTIIMRAVVDIKKKGKLFELSTKKEIYQAKMLLFATGSTWKELNVKGEEEFKNKGVHYCASCDAPLYKGKKTAVVVGGGDSAMEEAIFLTKFASSVTLIHRRNSFRASKIMQKRALNNNKIKVSVDNEEIYADWILCLNTKFYAGHYPVANTNILCDHIRMDMEYINGSNGFLDRTDRLMHYALVPDAVRQIWMEQNVNHRIIQISMTAYGFPFNFVMQNE